MPKQQSKSRKRTTYIDIFDTLTSEIVSGSFAVGDQMPTEKELVERFNVARPTVREALRRLEDLGHIRRRRGTRSVLVSATPANTFINSVKSVEELLLYANVAHWRIVGSSRVIADETLSRALGCDIGQQWLRVDFLRYQSPSDEPLCYSNIYFHPKFHKILPLLWKSPTVYNLIEKTFSIKFSQIEQHIEAESADESIAMPLNVKIDSPVLKVRTAFSTREDGMLEVSLTWFPKGRYRMQINLERRSI